MPERRVPADVGRRADTFLHARLGQAGRPLVVVTHGHFSRILAARALRLPPEQGRLLASTTAAVSLIEDHHGERCIGLWNADATLLADVADPTAPPGGARPDPLVGAAGFLR